MFDKEEEIVFTVTCGPISCGPESFTFSSTRKQEGKLLAMDPMPDEQWRVNRAAFEISGPEHLILRVPMTFLHYGSPAREEICAKQLAFLDRVCALLNDQRAALSETQPEEPRR